MTEEVEAAMRILIDSVKELNGVVTEIVLKGNTTEEQIHHEAAMAAMQGICAVGHTFWDSSRFQGCPIEIVKASLEIADEYIKQRKERKDEN